MVVLFIKERRKPIHAINFHLHQLGRRIVFISILMVLQVFHHVDNYLLCVAWVDKYVGRRQNDAKIFFIWTQIDKIWSALINKRNGIFMLIFY